jgi:hypothetical protein
MKYYTSIRNTDTYQCCSTTLVTSTSEAHNSTVCTYLEYSLNACPGLTLPVLPALCVADALLTHVAANC